MTSGGTTAPRVANFCSLPTNGAPASLGGFQTPPADFGVAATPPIVEGGVQAEPSAAQSTISEAARRTGARRGENREEIIVSKDTLQAHRTFRSEVLARAYLAPSALHWPLLHEWQILT